VFVRELNYVKQNSNICYDGWEKSASFDKSSQMDNFVLLLWLHIGLTK
jgi:hypothetical protein